MADLPLYVAQDQGIFAQQGLDVTISQIPDLSTLPGAMGKQFDFGLSSQPVFLAAVENRVPVVVTAGGQYENKDTPNIQLIVGANSGIESASDLKGKTIGVPQPKSNMGFCLQYWMKQNGADPNSVVFRAVPFPSMSDQIQAGRIDGAVPVQPFTAQLIKNGDKAVATPCLSISPTSQGTFLISEKTWAQQHKTVVLAMQHSMAAAISWIEAHPADAKAVLLKSTGMPKALVDSMKLPLFNSVEPKSDLDAWIKALKALGQLSGPDLKSSDLVFPSK